MEIEIIKYDKEYAKYASDAVREYGGMNDDYIVHDLLTKLNLTISTAESCSGGLVASTLNSFDGASKYFMGGVCAYQTPLKEKLLGVGKDTIENHGVVSDMTVLEMAGGAMSMFDSDIAVSTSGYIGKDGGDEFACNGTVWMCVMCEDVALVAKTIMPSTHDREVKKRLVVSSVMELLVSLLWKKRKEGN